MIQYNDSYFKNFSGQHFTIPTLYYAILADTDTYHFISLLGHVYKDLL